MKLKTGLKTTIAVLGTLMASTAFAQDAKVLNFWTWSPAEPVVQKVIAAFEAENPGVDVKLTFLESTAYQDRLPLALSSGDEIDVAAVQTSTMVKLVKDYLEPLPPLFKQNGLASFDQLYAARAIEQAKLLAGDDTVYIAPFCVLGSVVVYYNMDMLKELGLSIPRTRAELAAFVETVKAKRPDLVPISFTGGNWFLDEIADTIAEQASPGFFNSVRYNQGGKWNGPEFKAAFDGIVSLYKDGVFSRDTLDLDYGRAVELFQRGQAVAFIQGTWESGILSAPYRKANGIKLDNVSAAGFPVVVEGGTPAIRSFIEVGLGVPKTSTNKELAAKFVAFVTSGAGVDQWADSLFVVPVANGYKLDPATFSTEAAGNGYAEISHLLLSPSSDRNNVSDFSAVVGDTITDSILNGTDTQAQLDHLQSEWESGRYSNAK